MIEDAAKVAPHVYKVLFENDRVRVLEARLAPGVKTQMHSHPAQVVYGLSGGTVKLTHPGGDSVEVEVRRGEVVFFAPEEHATDNVGGTEVHVLMVEPK